MSWFVSTVVKQPGHEADSFTLVPKMAGAKPPHAYTLSWRGALFSTDDLHYHNYVLRVDIFITIVVKNVFPNMIQDVLASQEGLCSV
jgi:hypothetical protein